MNLIRGRQPLPVVKLTFERAGKIRTIEAHRSDSGWSVTVREDNQIMANMKFGDRTEDEMTASFKESMASSGFKEIAA